MVPTMFVRMLKLPDDVRASYDVSSLRVVVHAAAPCPLDVKSGMIEWFGPIIHEHYASTESNGATFIDPERTASTQHPAHPNWTTVGDLGYGGPAYCDARGCGNEIDRGPGYTCQARLGDEDEATLPDEHPDWHRHVLEDESRERWRSDEPVRVEQYKEMLARATKSQPRIPNKVRRTA
jgi:acyl-CoA synthetase (AMP-forming)/AMP-acid ligase II